MKVAKSSAVSIGAGGRRYRPHALTTTSGTALTSTKLGITRQSSSVSYGQVLTSATGAAAAGNYSTPTMSNLDSDGLTELIQGQGDGTILVFEQTAANAATFGTGILLKNADGTTRDVGNFAKPTLADLDGDGLLELLVGEDTGTGLRYEQTAATGTGAYSLTKTTCRLRQVDLDGTATYSPVVTLAASAAAAKPVAYPTVFTTELSVALLTADGRAVYSRTVQLGTAPRPWPSCPC